jgi:protein-disulfide isomerase
MSRKADAGALVLPVGDRDHTQGRADAPVTLVEYGDFECPYCRQAFPIVKEVQSRMGARLRFVFRHFPLTELHHHAQHAAEVAEAAGAQGAGAFWQMHGRLFERQFALEDENLIEYAQELGLDADRVAGELAARTHKARVREDFMSGVRSGVNGTPAFFINGMRHDESWDLETLTKRVESSFS